MCILRLCFHSRPTTMWVIFHPLEYLLLIAWPDCCFVPNIWRSTCNEESYIDQGGNTFNARGYGWKCRCPHFLCDSGTAGVVQWRRDRKDDGLVKGEENLQAEYGAGCRSWKEGSKRRGWQPVRWWAWRIGSSHIGKHGTERSSKLTTLEECNPYIHARWMWIPWPCSVSALILHLHEYPQCLNASTLAKSPWRNTENNKFDRDNLNNHSPETSDDSSTDSHLSDLVVVCGTGTRSRSLGSSSRRGCTRSSDTNLWLCVIACWSLGVKSQHNQYTR